jgi:ubiquinone/menaquinone biosynthesis C-methylase UbiE
MIKEIFTDDNVFTGVLGEHYRTIKLICPLAATMSHLVGDTVRDYATSLDRKLNIVEIGGGTGITTLSILLAADNLVIDSIDNAATMQQQAKVSLKPWTEKGKVNFIENDALSALKVIANNSVDIVASAYTLHNFEHTYRALLISEVFRILKKGGEFINGDRYGLDDISTHTAMIQKEIAHYFKVLTAEKKPDLLEHWITHLFADEAENRVMRETVSIEQLKKAGFVEVKLSQRTEVNALVTAIKN